MVNRRPNAIGFLLDNKVGFRAKDFMNGSNYSIAGMRIKDPLRSSIFTCRCCLECPNILDEFRTGCTEDHESPEAPVSLFGYSDDNYFITMDTISQLCREEAEVDSVQESEIEWLSSTIIFLKVKYFAV